MAIYAIGDIHGNLTALKTIFKHGNFKSEDTFVFLGDYVDRGPNSKGVLDWLLANESNYNFKYILGNHEIMMKTAASSKDRLMEWLYFGGDATLNSYNIGDDPCWFDEVPARHWKFIDECLPYLVIGDYIFVHAGLEKGKRLEDQNKHHLFWQKFVEPEMYQEGKEVICGHTSRKNGEIAYFGHTTCIDTYAYGGMWLSCLNVVTKEFIQADESGMVQKGELPNQQTN